MIASNCLNLNTFHHDFYTTLEKDCLQEREQFCKANNNPNLIAKTKSGWCFETSLANQRVIKALERIRTSLETAKNKGFSEGVINLHYCLGNVDTKGDKTRNLVYIVNQESILNIQDAIDGDLFDKVILPCFRKMCEKAGTSCQLTIGKKGSLSVSSIKEVSFAQFVPVTERLETVHVELKTRWDGFETVNRSGKNQLRNKDVAAVWDRQHSLT